MDHSHRMDIEYLRCTSSDELEQILQLQKVNLATNISMEEKADEGFLTVEHSLDILKKMNDACPHILAKANGELAGYALCMHPVFAEEIPVLRPMFEKIRSIGKDSLNYMVMGQICVGKLFRKRGVFRGLYNYMSSALKSEYNSIITEVDAENIRSLQAHYSVGFNDLLVYDSGARTWHLIGWEIS